MTVPSRRGCSSHKRIGPSESLDDIHFNLAQEITRAMATSRPSSHNSSSDSNSAGHDAIQLNTAQEVCADKTINKYGNKIESTIAKFSRPVKIQVRAPVAKPSPAEEELVRCIHRKVGGPAKLSTYDDPAKVRNVVIEALAVEQVSHLDASRIRRGQLSVFERRVVRTVTNRGAAVRSRMRQRKEVAQLKHELRLRDAKVKHLELTIRTLCSRLPISIVEASTSSVDDWPDYLRRQGEMETEPETESRESMPATKESTPGIDAPDFALNQELFGDIVDQVITRPPWS